MNTLNIGQYDVWTKIEDISELQEQIDEVLVTINMIGLDVSLNRNNSYSSKDQMEIIKLIASLNTDISFKVVFSISEHGYLTAIRFSGKLRNISISYGDIEEKVTPQLKNSFPLQVMKLLLMKV